MPVSAVGDAWEQKQQLKPIEAGVCVCAPTELTAVVAVGLCLLACTHVVGAVGGGNANL